MAAENIILTALEEGSGCCPLLFFNRENVTKLLNIPEKYDIALVIAMGYPPNHRLSGCR
jgi:nitroreductase